jgi:HSP20 family molecular chaperone IbpA
MEVEDFLDLLVFEDMLDEMLESEYNLISKKIGFQKNLQKELLVDVINEKDFVRVAAEMPSGVCKNDIKLFSTSLTLEIIVNGKVLSNVDLPAAVEKAGKAIFKNGFLEVLLKKVEGWGIEFE